jgi:hypothetical protein
MNEFPPADWADFFVAEVGASAALTGLVIVAISINLSRILSFAYLPGRAADALFTLVGALILTSAALVPHQPELAFGIETLAIGLVMFFGPVALQARIMKAGHSIPTLWSFTRALLSSVPSIPIVVAGALLMLGWSAGLYWIAAGVILSLVAGVLTAWVLLIEILR